MKLYRSILDRLIDLQSYDHKALRSLLDEVGLEVKSVEERQDDVVFTIETLANRGDHLSAQGVARELSAKLLCKTHTVPVSQLDDRKISFIVKNETPTSCYRYGLMELHISSQFKLPSMISSVLQSDSSKHPIVDVLNYTALEIDKDKVEGEVIVALTTTPEKIDALDGKQYTVPADSIVIKDRKKIIAVAGVIGCANTMVTNATTKTLIESASFDPVKVRKTARAMGISTDASHAFERGSDIEAIIPALKRVLYLTQDGSPNAAQCVGYTLLQSTDDELPFNSQKVTVRVSELKSQMHSPRLDLNEVFARLKNLGFGVEYQATEKIALLKEFTVSVPSWRRWEVTHEQDIIEEFARTHGLMSIKQELPALDYKLPEYNPHERLLKSFEPVLIGSGFTEVMTRSFYSAEDVEFVEKIDKHSKDKHVRLKNSIETAFAALKTNNIVSITSMLATNFRRGIQSAKIFEFGKIFTKADQSDNAPNEIETVTLAAAGRWYEGEWQKGQDLSEIFYLTKGVVNNLLATLNIKPTYEAGKDPYLHPGIQALIYDGRRLLGSIGAVHPMILERVELKAPTVVVTLNAAALMKERKSNSFIEPNDLPSIRRDLTLSIPNNYFASEVINSVIKKSISNLQDICLVDDFKKPNEDFRRVTFRFTFQSKEKTLEHSFVDEQMKIITQYLNTDLNIKIAE
jgi:phenylalanyl-tRNA synthetase beta chain